jgi:hypothetical protein
VRVGRGVGEESAHKTASRTRTGMTMTKMTTPAIMPPIAPVFRVAVPEEELPEELVQVQPGQQDWPPPPCVPPLPPLPPPLRGVFEGVGVAKRVDVDVVENEAMASGHGRLEVE